MADLLHIYIFPKVGVEREQIEKKLDLAVDWFRYSNNCYLVYTTKDIKVWDARLRGFVSPGGNLLILEIDPYDYNGWMPKDLWPWLEEKKKKIYGDND